MNPASRARWRSFGRLCTGYWRSEERWRAAALALGIIALIVAQTRVNVSMNEWNGLFFNALQDRDAAAFRHQLLRFSWLVLLWAGLNVYVGYLRQVLQVGWRSWLTRHYTDRWLADARFLHIQRASAPAADNPDQRIAEDLALFTSTTIELSFGLFGSALNLYAFVGILWRLSAPVSVFGVVLPGDLLWAAVLYASVNSAITHLVGHRLVGLNVAHQRFEADFRFALVRIRENAESIAAARGAGEEARSLAASFGHVLRNQFRIFGRERWVNGFTSLSYQSSVVVCYLVLAPRYFSGRLSLGGLTQTQAAFVSVSGLLSWFVGVYKTWAVWRATLARLLGFDAALAAATVNDGALRALPLPQGAALAAAGVSIWLPDGRMLWRDVSLQLPRGSRTLLVGPSGCGKSVLLKTLCGLWPHSAGLLAALPPERCLLLPQRPFLATGSLRRVVAYPSPAGRWRDADVARALADCGLDELVPRLDETADWSSLLSIGEQQRLGFAHALLAAPDFLFLDEATSALDPAAESALHRVLRARLPEATVLSVGHGPSLLALHERQLHWPRLDADV